MIRISNLSKKFKIYRSKIDLIKCALGLGKEGRNFDYVSALTNINLDLKPGEVHGIVGLNGAGKSTLLKILTGVIKPTSGALNIDGRVAALLELGTGFHAELTGRENIYLSASIAGLTTKQIDEKIDSILEFSELGDFFDKPIRIYSSGMYVRLAFSLAISVMPEVLIIDEALSVGDAYFQQKCLDKIFEFKNQGVTILFVSHDLAAVKILCDNLSLLSKGKLIFTGSVLKGLEIYNAFLADQANASEEAVIQMLSDNQNKEGIQSGSKKASITKVSIKNSQLTETSCFVCGDKITIEVDCLINTDLETPTCGILIKDRLGYDIFGVNSYQLGYTNTQNISANSSINYKFDIDALNLGPGNYTVTVALHSSRTHINNNYDWKNRVSLIQVLGKNDYEFSGVVKLQTQISAELTK